MKAKLLVKGSNNISMHFDNLTNKEYDAMRNMLQSTMENSLVFGTLDFSGVSLEELISQADKLKG